MSPAEDEGGADSALPFRQVAQDLPTPCWISDAEGRIVWVNAAWVTYTGFDVARIESEGLEQLHDAAIYPKVQQRWLDVKRAGEPAEMTFPLRGRDGSLRPFLTRVVPLRDAAGRITRWFGTNTDVSERAHAEKALREAEQRLALATEAAELGVWDWNLLDNTFVYSPRARAIAGFSLDAAVTLEDVVRTTHPDDYPRTWAMAQRALDPQIRASEKYQYRIVRTDGTIRHVEAHGRALFEMSADGVEKAVRYVGTLQDITDVVALTEQSRESQALLRSLFDASELFIAVLELTEDSFRYILVNRATAAFYHRPDDAKAFDARDVGIPEHEIAQWRATLLDVLETNAPRTIEYEFDGGQGPGWYVGTYSPLPAGPKGERRVSFVVIDVTDRKRAEQQQALLLREVDHRAKNVLAVAQAVVELTRADTPDAFRRAVRGRIAALARVHTVLADERWVGADLARLVDEELAPYQSERASQISISGPPVALPPATAQSLGLVIHELATNAAKYGALNDRDGELSVSWTYDSSTGLAMVWREATRQPLTPMKPRGFGFTMLEQAIKHQLGGDWSVEPSTHGVIYRISLPPRSAIIVREVTSREGVLIVEDEGLVALALEAELKQLGVTVGAVAARLAEAELLIASRRFPVAFLDLNLAGDSTVELGRALARSGTAVVFCTGYQSPDLPSDLAEAPVLQKPVLPSDLRRTLDALGFATFPG